jgi:UDP-N-acetylglucosamine--N-acetylmuramyl-(pentapeptide) pyrophosphoryl-undecaprenol N-acetylglucosamine transferase
MAVAYRSADFAIAGAGAGTLAELALAGLPVLVVPLVSAADAHQLANARVFAAKTGTMVRAESEWATNEIADLIRDVVATPESWRAASRGMRGAANGAAADALAGGCAELLRRRGRVTARAET